MNRMNVSRRKEQGQSYRLLGTEDSETEEFSQAKSHGKLRKHRCRINPRCRLLAILASLIIILGSATILYLLKQGGYECPAGCQCGYLSSGGSPLYGVGCDGLELNLIPDNLPQQTTDLALGYNKLTSIEVSALKKLPHLRLLYLGNNKLEKVNNEALEFFISLGNRLVALDLSGNPWDCSCHPETVQFIKWLEEIRVPTRILDEKHWIALVDGYNTTCVSPPKMKGKSFDHLGHSDICPQTRSLPL